MSDQNNGAFGDGIFGDGFYCGDKDSGSFTPTPKDVAEIVELQNQVKALEARCRTLEQERQALQDAHRITKAHLRKHGRHANDCPSFCDDRGELVNSYRDWGCTCGFSEAKG